ncbi:type 2 periplasmic-binding domain-containing protein [Pseudobutyrivibrio xylanivorans]|jgi:putative aldouronate transport system substrate-binding protein|uniref:Putative aldouronate transport system substrate-binding protein n=1 Tax=Pseudobutyrivibrio xylanivorans DSM 14809 TaxID=1123012 RepID=A0A1M6A5F5_PSEXY|nr:sugar ABC transporter substrate-binding protein [Pseudobutyrivibrio xylanivorans]SHI31667.1 putative aldouronate transport system substrate-binding protein [Pseudobutyrivibrio xylanivorans DSM 14809]
MKKKIVSAVLCAAMLSSMFAGCGKQAASGGAVNEDGIKEFTAFFAVPGSEINDDNEIQQIIAEKTGCKVKETWLTGQTAEEAVGTLIAGGEYPDFIEGGNGSKQLYEAGALVALDDYIDKYPNIKEYFTEQEWDQLRQSDGHIYWIPQFSNIYGQERACTHNDEAFWIQARVLEWAGYPKIETMDEYFDLIEKYNEANPTMADGTTANIPYTILCDDWRYFCLENAPEFLDGYPNDGSVIVDPEKLQVIDYNTTDTAVKYFKKLNEEYHKGIVDPESFTQTYDEYIAKISSGRVLGMIDQWWDFAYTGEDAIKSAGLDEQGCQYVPLPITIEKGMKNQWHNSGGVLNVSSGLAITTSCKDVDAALQFVNDLLDQEIHDLRFWGVKDVDYKVGDDGLYYRTPEMRKQAADTAYKAAHTCSYSYFPQYSGTSRDGKNAMKSDGQEQEFFDGLSEPIKKCFEAYGAKTYVEMLGTSEKPGDWYPMYTYSNTLTTDTPGGTAWTKMGEIKHQYLPKVVMADDFDKGWAEYMKVYEECKPEDFISEMQTELERRMTEAAKYK